MKEMKYTKSLAILKEAADKKATDVFVIPGAPIKFKISKRLETSVLLHKRLTPKDTEAFVTDLYAQAHRDVEAFRSHHQKDDDFSFAVPGLGRLRINVFRQRGSEALVVRIIPFSIPTPINSGVPAGNQVVIPDEVMDCADFEKGLVLVTGPSGVGKTTTLACMIDRINSSGVNKHIITMEDPIEYVHSHKDCLVTQREVGTDVDEYATALRSAMRESPDVILLGEMRDAETIETAVTAAEMSQLIFSTLHTNSASAAVDRIIDAFPAEQQRQIRIQLSMVLEAVICQQLIPVDNGNGSSVEPVFEVMKVTPAIRNLIREGKTYQIPSAIKSGEALGMRTMDDSLMALVDEGKITLERAMQYSTQGENLRRQYESRRLNR